MKNTKAVLFIWNGTDDNTTPMSFAKYLSRQYSPAKLHIVENMGLCYISRIGKKF